MNINFITTNPLKFNITKAYFDPFGDQFVLKQHAIDVPEMQSDSVNAIAEQSAKWAAEEIGEPAITSDVGFFIEALGGFPGPFIKYVGSQLTTDGFLRLMNGVENRRAYFEDALTVAFPDGTTKTFIRREWGVVAETSESKESKWPANELFIPDGYESPLGTLSNDEQVAFWGDGSWPKLVEYLQAEAR